MDIKQRLVEARLWAEMYAINNPRRVVTICAVSLLLNVALIL
jgi:hypothetical protein